MASSASHKWSLSSSQISLVRVLQSPLSALGSLWGGWNPSLTVPQPQEVTIPAEMALLHINIDDTKHIYHCWVEGCWEGPLTSCTTICAHVCQAHLGMKLSCPSPPVLSSILMTSGDMASGCIGLDLQTQPKECWCSHVHKKEFISKNSCVREIILLIPLLSVKEVILSFLSTNLQWSCLH